MVLMTINRLKENLLTSRDTLQIHLASQRNFRMRGKTTFLAIDISPVFQVTTLVDRPIRVGIINQAIITTPGVSF